MKINTDFIKGLNPCRNRYENWLKHYKYFEGTFEEFIRLNEITFTDKIWLGVRLLNRPNRIEFACRCAELVLPIYAKFNPNIFKLTNAIMAARDFVSGRNAANAAYAASYAAYAADAAIDGTTNATYAAYAASYAADAAYAAANAASHDAAYAASHDAASAANAAASAANAAYAAYAAYAASYAADAAIEGATNAANAAASAANAAYENDILEIIESLLNVKGGFEK